MEPLKIVSLVIGAERKPDSEQPKRFTSRMRFRGYTRKDNRLSAAQQKTLVRLSCDLKIRATQARQELQKANEHANNILDAIIAGRTQPAAPQSDSMQPDPVLITAGTAAPAYRYHEG